MGLKKEPVLLHASCLYPSKNKREKAAYCNRITYVKEGRGMLCVNGKKMPLEAGVVSAMKAGDIYLFSQGEQSRLCLISLFFNGDDEMPAASYMKNMQRFQRDFSDIVQEYKSGQVFSEIRLNYMLAMLLIDLYRYENTEKSNHVAQEVRSYIDSNLGRPLKNSDIANSLGYNTDYLAAKIKKELGRSLHQYIIHAKLLKAAELLESSEKTITEIAEETGFKDVGHFSKLFRKKMGFSPSQLRKK